MPFLPKADLWTRLNRNYARPEKSLRIESTCPHAAEWHLDMSKEASGKVILSGSLSPTA